MFVTNRWAPAVSSEYTRHQFWNGANNPRRQLKVHGVFIFNAGSLGINGLIDAVQAPGSTLASGEDVTGRDRNPTYTFYRGDSVTPAPSGFLKVPVGVVASGVNIFRSPVTISPGKGLSIAAANSNLAIQITVWWEEIFRAGVN